MTALFSSGWSGMGLLDDIERGSMDRFLVGPRIAPRSSSAGIAHEGINLVIQASSSAASAGCSARASRAGSSASRVLVLGVVLLAFTFASLSNALALILRQRESVIGVNQFLVLPLTFLSAAFMPLALVPDWIADVRARFNPVNWAVEAGRDALLGSPDWGSSRCVSVD